MASQPYSKVLQEALELSPEQQRALMSDLMRALANQPKKSIKEYFGMLGKPAEDA